MISISFGACMIVVNLMKCSETVVCPEERVGLPRERRYSFYRTLKVFVLALIGNMHQTSHKEFLTAI